MLNIKFLFCFYFILLFTSVSVSDVFFCIEKKKKKEEIQNFLQIIIIFSASFCSESFVLEKNPCEKYYDINYCCTTFLLTLLSLFCRLNEIFFWCIVENYENEFSFHLIYIFLNRHSFLLYL